MPLVAAEPPTWEAPQRASICWVQVGTVQGTFATTWGSSGWDLFGARATFSLTMDGIATTPGNVTANARVSDDANLGDRGLVEILGRGEGPFIHLVNVSFPLRSVAAGVAIPIDWEPSEGYLGVFDSASQTFELQGFLLGGTLTFEEAFPLLGEPIRGRIDAPVLRAP